MVTVAVAGPPVGLPAGTAKTVLQRAAVVKKN